MINLMRHSLLYVFLACVAGCASGCTGAQIEATRISNGFKQTNDQILPCLAQVYSKPEYANLETKLYIGTEFQFPLHYLTDPSKPNKSEIADLYNLWDELQPCRKIALEGASTVHALLFGAVVNYYSELDRLWIDAVKGNLTWGNFNESRQSAVRQFSDKLIQADTQIKSQLQSQHQFELEQRQRAAVAMQQWIYQQQQIAAERQAIAAANRPRIINCNYYGSTATCNSN